MSRDKPSGPLIIVPKTQCIHGHEFTPENIYWAHQKNLANPYRVCKQCRLNHQRHYNSTHLEWKRQVTRNWQRKYRLANRGNYAFMEAERQRQNRWNAENPERAKAQGRAAYWRLQCIACGFTDERALQIDHVDGGGNKERRTRGAQGIYRRAIEVFGTNEYQLLCANCNWIKAHETETYKEVQGVGVD